MKKFKFVGLLILSLIISIIFSISASNIKITNKNKNIDEILIVYLGIQDKTSNIPNVLNIQALSISDIYGKSKDYKLEIPQNTIELSINIKNKQNKAFLLGSLKNDKVEYDKFKISNIDLSISDENILLIINSKRIEYIFDKIKQNYIRK